MPAVDILYPTFVIPRPAYFTGPTSMDDLHIVGVREYKPKMLPGNAGSSTTTTSAYGLHSFSDGRLLLPALFPTRSLPARYEGGFLEAPARHVN